MAWGSRRKLLQAGAKAPDFQLERLGGGVASLADALADGPALLAFFKVSCPVCQFTLPFLERIHASGGLAILGVSQNDAEDTRDFTRRFGIRFPVLLDSEDAEFPAGNAYGISSVPTMFLVERDGTVAQVIEGWSKRDIRDLGVRAGMAPFGQSDNVPEWKAG